MPLKIIASEAVFAALNEQLDRRDANPGEKALRDEITTALEAQKAAIEQLIAEFHEAGHHEGLDDVIDRLEAQRQQVDDALLNAHLAGSNGLWQIARTVQAGAHSLSGIAAFGRTQQAVLVAEMTHSARETIHAAHDRAAKAFAEYANQTGERIEALAAANGVDIAVWQRLDETYQQQRAKAEADGDRPGMFRADALRASSLVQGLVKVGAEPDAIEEAREKEEEARQRFLREHAIEARRLGHAQGLRGEALDAHVARSVSDADAGLRRQQERNARELGLTGAEAAQDRVHQYQWEANRERMARANEDGKWQGSDSDRHADQQELIANKDELAATFSAALSAGTGIGPPQESDPGEAKQPPFPEQQSNSCSGRGPA